MKKVFSTIAVTLPATIVGLVLGFAGLIALLSYNSAHSGLEEQASQKLRLALEAHAQDLEVWRDSITADIQILSQSPDVTAAVAGFHGAWAELGTAASQTLKARYIDRNPHPPGEREKLEQAGDDIAYSVLHGRIQPFLRSFIETREYYDAFLIDSDGNVLYTVEKEADFADNLRNGPLRESGLGRAFALALDAPADATVFVDFAPYAPSAGAPAGFVARRIPGPDGRAAGVVALQLSNGRLNDIVNDAVSLGRTGHMTLVGEDMLTRNASRFDNGGGFLGPAEDSAEVRAALNGDAGLNADASGHDGNAVFVAYRPVEFIGTRWAFLVEQDRGELMAQAVGLWNRMLILIAVIGALGSALGIFSARRITRPLAAIGSSMDRMAANDFTTEVPHVSRNDEVGAIARNLDAFRGALAAAEVAQRMTVYRGRAFNASGTPTMVVDRDFNVIDCNAAFVALATDQQDVFRRNWPEFDPASLVGQPIHRVHPGFAVIRDIASDPSKLPHDADLPFGEVLIALHVAAILDDTGHYIGSTLQWEDARDERTNRSIIAAIRKNQVMIEYDLDFMVVRTNDVFSKVFGYGDEAIGRSFEALFGPNEDTAIQMERLRGGLTVTRKVKRKTKTGEDVWIETVMNPIQDRAGRLDRIVEIGTDFTALEMVRIEAEAEKAANAEALDKVVSHLRAGLSRLADGDLTSQIDDDFAPEYDALRTNFNIALRQLSGIVAQMIGSAECISSGAVEINEAADELSRRTEQQAAALEETAAALDELTASVKAATDTAAQADKAVQGTREGAEQSKRVVQEAVEAMSQIESSSKQISQIIGVIDEIAFQTNLLALNAGVEAARAGDAGRGFAVVASEVRALAQRSSEAAKEITSLISSSTRQVERGVALVGQTGDALHTIVDRVVNISTMVSEIAEGAREQSAGLSEINTSVNQMDHVTQHNAAMAEQSTAASNALRQEAQQLADMVTRFSIPPDAAAEAKPAAAFASIRASDRVRSRGPEPAPVAHGDHAAQAGTGPAASSESAAALPAAEPLRKVAGVRPGWEEF